MIMPMKGLERITNIRLAEVLTQKGHVTREEMADTIASQEATGESFANVLISAGYLTEWDLARLVSEYFQIPFLLAERYESPSEVIESLETEFMFEHMLLPLDQFGSVLTVAVPVFLPGEVLQEIQEKKELDVFPVVSLFSENKKKLVDHFPDFKIVEKKPKPTKKVDISGGEWENIFDMGDEAVQQDLKE